MDEYIFLFLTRLIDSERCWKRGRGREICKKFINPRNIVPPTWNRWFSSIEEKTTRFSSIELEKGEEESETKRKTLHTAESHISNSICLPSPLLTGRSNEKPFFSPDTEKRRKGEEEEESRCRREGHCRGGEATKYYPVRRFGVQSSIDNRGGYVVDLADSIYDPHPRFSVISEACADERYPSVARDIPTFDSLQNFFLEISIHTLIVRL